MACWLGDEGLHILRKFRVRISFRAALAHRIRRRNRSPNDDSGSLSERELEILADDPDVAKVKARQLLKGEGYDDRSLHRATWTVSRLNRPRKR